MTEETDDVVAPVEAAEEATVAVEKTASEVDKTEVTVWAPEPSTDADDVMSLSVDEWRWPTAVRDSSAHSVSTRALMTTPPPGRRRTRAASVAAGSSASARCRSWPQKPSVR